MSKTTVVSIGFLLLFCGCKKTVEKIAENAILNAMTDGQWIVTSFKQNGTDITNSFSAYKFQYYRDKTVDAIKNGIVEEKGNWDGDALAKTTWANFPDAIAPIDLLNGTWQINDNGWTYVIATQTTGTEIKNLRLDKQ
jgi:hypothetical protein